ncbi:hypothetical protein [Janthinobacterium sp. PSPC3-1]
MDIDFIMEAAGLLLLAVLAVAAIVLYGCLLFHMILAMCEK